MEEKNNESVENVYVENETNNTVGENQDNTFVEEKSQNGKSKAPIIIIVVILVIGGIVGLVLFSQYSSKLEDYNRAMSLLEGKEYERAKNLFISLEDFKDSQTMVIEVDYVEANDMLEKSGTYYSLYESDIKDALRTLYSIIDYKDSRQILRSKYDEFTGEITKQMEVKNSIQKDYDVSELLSIIKSISIDEDFTEEKKDFICKFSTQAYNEGFVSYSYTSNIEFYCDDKSVLTTGKNANYYILTDKSWSIIETKGSGFASYVESKFIQFLTTDVMTYEESMMSLYGSPEIKYAYWYKVVDNVIYVKEYRNDDYVKKFTITSINENSLRFREINGVFEAL